MKRAPNVETRVGKCWWCKRTDATTARGWDQLWKCVDREDCNNHRNLTLIVQGVRPSSWYARLAEGWYPARRDARKAGLTNDQIRELVEGMGLTYSVKERRPTDEPEACGPDCTRAHVHA